MNQSASSEFVKREHIDFARGAAARDRAEKSGYRPMGHEAFLKHLEGSGVPIAVTKMDGTIITGQIKASDHTTISIKEETGVPGAYLTRVLFKHAIAEFQPMISLAPTQEVH